jgi:DNA-binding NarL/FixJ family response regulator
MSDNRRIRVLLAEDHTLFRRALACVLQSEPGFEVAGEAEDGVDAVAKASSVHADVILMDVQMPTMSGLEATRRILATSPQVKILMLTMSEDDDVVFEAVKSGAQGYLLKTIEPRDLFEAIRGVVRGEAPMSGSLAAKLLREFARQAQQPPQAEPPRPRLDPREQEILALVADGKSNKDIATVMALAENTVKSHMKRILHTLHLENRVQAAVFAVREDLGIPSSGRGALAPPARCPEAS